MSAALDAAPGRELPVLAVVGVGLIGGSFAAALRRAGKVGKVIGAGRSRDALVRAKGLGLIDEAVALEDAARQADIIALATPVGAIPAILSRLLPFLKPDALLTDVGSTKADVVKAARSALGDRSECFVPGHPIAGAEKTGPEAASADLFVGRTVVLTPLEENTEQCRTLAIDLWKACGARVVLMEPDAHDAALASVSHVPHFLASVFMAQVSGADDADLRLSLAGSGFRDFTRISAGSAEMWQDIFMANRDAVLQELKAFRALLEQTESALAQGDARELHELLERAAVARRFWGSRSGHE
ncbi:prephenate dehydrogenase [Paracandidimonas soli]|uniref:prephenate dehydrogenase n=1 Tax=Paracandidimonas soli TaxID=1917182 RepID=UPI0033424DB3